MNLPNSDTTISVSDGETFTLPANTLTASRICTLSVLGTITGNPITIRRVDATAHAYTITTNGPGGFEFDLESGVEVAFRFSEAAGEFGILTTKAL